MNHLLQATIEVPDEVFSGDLRAFETARRKYQEKFYAEVGQRFDEKLLQVTGIDYSKIEESRTVVAIHDMYRKSILGYFQIPEKEMREIMAQPFNEPRGIYFQQEKCGCFTSGDGYRSIFMCRSGHFTSDVPGWRQFTEIHNREFKRWSVMVKHLPYDNYHAEAPIGLSKGFPQQPQQDKPDLASLEKRVAALEVQMKTRESENAALRKLIDEQEKRLKEVVTAYSCRRCGAKFGEEHRYAHRD